MKGCVSVDALARVLITRRGRSEFVEWALRNEHLRRALDTYTTRTAPALDIDSYAEQVYEANRAAGLDPGG
jgi:hypothetical protein